MVGIDTGQIFLNLINPS